MKDVNVLEKYRGWIFFNIENYSNYLLLFIKAEIDMHLTNLNIKHTHFVMW